jgi:hypothetical protein
LSSAAAWNIRPKGNKMENMGKWKIVKIGFWLGIGFSVPLLCIIFGGSIINTLLIPPIIESSYEEDWTDSYSANSKGANPDRIKIATYKEQTYGNRLVILGVIENVSDMKASSIQLEAELINSAGEFVYECSEYISKVLQPGEKENFQINCGCGDTVIPDYNKTSLRVVSVSNY